jgi:hypothetical protein
LHKLLLAAHALAASGEKPENHFKGEIDPYDKQQVCSRIQADAVDALDQQRFIKQVHDDNRSKQKAAYDQFGKMGFVHSVRHKLIV